MFFVDKKRIHTFSVIQDRETLTHGLITQWSCERRATVAEEGPLPCIEAVALVLAGIGHAYTLNLNTKKKSLISLFCHIRKGNQFLTHVYYLCKKKIAKNTSLYFTGILKKVHQKKRCGTRQINLYDHSHANRAKAVFSFSIFT